MNAIALLRPSQLSSLRETSETVYRGLAVISSVEDAVEEVVVGGGYGWRYGCGEKWKRVRKARIVGWEIWVGGVVQSVEDDSSCADNS